MSTAGRREWPAARLERLAALWAEGYSASRIAANLGITRNAVIGMAHRRHLPARLSPIIRSVGYIPRPRAIPRAPRSTLPTLGCLARKAPPPATPAPRERVVRVPAEPPKPTPFKTCQWILSDGRPWTFCAEPVDPAHGVYCREHAKAARGSVPRPLDGLEGIAA